MMREYSITTCEGSCTPQKTADPSIAGVKKGRPLIVSTIKNHRATAAAPRQPATNPSRKIRVSCMRSPEARWVNISLKTARARLGPTARSTTDGRLAPLALLPAVPPRRRAAVRERRAGASAAHRRRPDAARRHRRDAGVAHDPLGAAVRLAADVRGADRARTASRRDGGRSVGSRRGVARGARVRGVESECAVHGGRGMAPRARLRRGGSGSHRDASDLRLRHAASVRPGGGAGRDVHGGTRAVRLRLGHPYRAGVSALAGLARHRDRRDRGRGGGGIHRVLAQHVLRPGARRRMVRRGGDADAPGPARARLTWEKQRPAPYGAGRSPPHRKAQRARRRTTRPAQPSDVSPLRVSTCRVTMSPAFTSFNASRSSWRARVGLPFTATMMSGPPSSSADSRRRYAGPSGETSVTISPPPSRMTGRRRGSRASSWVSGWTETPSISSLAPGSPPNRPRVFEATRAASSAGARASLTGTVLRSPPFRTMVT